MVLAAAYRQLTQQEVASAVVGMLAAVLAGLVEAGPDPGMEGSLDMARAGTGVLLVEGSLDRPALRMVDIVARRTCHMRRMLVVEDHVEDHVEDPEVDQPLAAEEPIHPADTLADYTHMGPLALGNLLAVVAEDSRGVGLVATPLAVAVVEDEKSD